MTNPRSNKLTQKRDAKIKAQIKEQKVVDKELPKQKYCIPIQLYPAEKAKWWERVPKSIIKWMQKFAALIIIISGLLIANDQFHEKITTTERLWKEKAYLEGVVIPLDNINYSKGITIVLGGSKNGKRMGIAEIFSIASLNDTIPFKPNFISIGLSKSTPFDLQFLLKKNRLYVSTILKDIDGKYVGKINFSNMELRPSKISNYHDGKDNLEIIDDNNYVLFNMQFMYPNIILINGYYVFDEGIQVASDSGFQSWPNRFLRGDSANQSLIGIIQKIPKLNSY